MFESDENLEKDERIESTVIKLRQWQLSQQHLPHNTNDSLLYQIAAVRKCDYNRCCTLLDTFYTVRSIVPEFFTCRDPLEEGIQRNAKCWAIYIHPGVTPDGCKLIILALMDPDPDKFEFMTFLRRVIMFGDKVLFNELYPGQGLYFVISGRNASFRYATKCSLSLFKKLVFCVQEAFPVRLKCCILIDINEMIRLPINTLFLPLVREKMRKRFQVLGSDYTKLYTVVPKEMLPIEFGGFAPSYREMCDKAHEELIGYRDWFLTEGSLKSDESLRKEKCPYSVPGCCVM